MKKILFLLLLAVPTVLFAQDRTNRYRYYQRPAEFLNANSGQSVMPTAIVIAQGFMLNGRRTVYGAI